MTMCTKSILHALCSVVSLCAIFPLDARGGTVLLTARGRLLTSAIWLTQGALLVPATAYRRVRYLLLVYLFVPTNLFAILPQIQLISSTYMTQARQLDTRRSRNSHCMCGRPLSRAHHACPRI